MKRFFDVCLSLLLLIAFLPLFFAIFIVLLFSGERKNIFWSKRVGANGVEFDMPKFRTMSRNTPIVATDELQNVEKYITKSGKFLRKYSLDELPQLFSVLQGSMSLVGPRPALPTQHELLILREKAGVAQLRPGITGWAQINGRDTIDLAEKVRLEVEYLEKQSLSFDIRILFLTIFMVFNSRGILH